MNVHENGPNPAASQWTSYASYDLISNQHLYPHGKQKTYYIIYYYYYFQFPRKLNKRPCIEICGACAEHDSCSSASPPVRLHYNDTCVLLVFVFALDNQTNRLDVTLDNIEYVHNINISVPVVRMNQMQVNFRLQSTKRSLSYCMWIVA